MPVMSEPQTSVHEYWLDAWQRSILFLDILRQRGNIYHEHNARTAPHVLEFEGELVRDGRLLERPVNYALVRMTPPDGVAADPSKPPFIVVDPRAGHGPGIGGMKAESEIGIALAAGHPCYFIGFLPEPVPGQTVEDVCRAEAIFIAAVAERHREAEGKPIIIANCQAGWQIMMTAALHPALAGPILLAGAPLSYWAGVRGKNPLRCFGGVMGGSWATAFTGDVGAGLFDGAHLVANFESLDLANTFWQKPYNVYSKVDTEGPRFLDFETWWGSPVLLNADEMQWIVDNLFIGDKLAAGALRTSEGVRIDLRNIRSPIVVFCSWGDNITPPQQALDWITDIYDDEREIAANGQTIVYTLHQSIGHLGIFVSGKVASKEHREFVSCMDMIDLAPPGLYEAVITEVDEHTDNPALIDGRYLFSLQRRTLDDIRALGANSADEQRCFAAAARVSDVNRSLYDAYLGPAVRATISEGAAEMLRRLHPNRLRFALFSDANPMMREVAEMAETVRAQRRPASPDNPLLAMEKTTSAWINASLDACGRARDAMVETMFFSIYGAPWVQAMAGLGQEQASQSRRMERDLMREATQAHLRLELEKRFEQGGSGEALLRGLSYVHRAEGGVDERANAVLREFRAAQPGEKRLTMAELKALMKEQGLLMRLDEERAVAAIPRLLPENAEHRSAALDILHNMIDVRGPLSPEGQRRLERIERLFNVKSQKPPRTEAANAAARAPGEQSQA
jgi:hypothetical protein